MDQNIIFLKVESGPLFSVLLDWRKRHRESTLAASNFAKSVGSGGYFKGLNGQLIGLLPMVHTPNGWKSSRRGKMIVPVIGKAGDSFRAAIAKLPAFPSEDEIAPALGYPSTVKYRYDGGYGFSGFGGFRPISIGWIDENTFIVSLADPQRVISSMRESEHYPGLVIESGDWRPDDNLTVISKAQCDLLYAQAAVKDEQAERAA